MGAFGTLLSALLKHPVIRAFCLELLARVFSEVIGGRRGADPAYRAQFLELSGELAGAVTEEEKRNVLKKLHALGEPSSKPADPQ